MWWLRWSVWDGYVGEVVLSHGVECEGIWRVTTTVPFLRRVNGQLTNTDSESAKSKTGEDIAD